MPEPVRNKLAVKSEFGIVVMRRMVQLGVAVIPQNFEVFYAAMSGSHPELAKELNQLGNAPVQSDIDRAASRFFTERLSNRVAGITHNRLTEIMETMKALIDTEAEDLTRFSDVMARASLEFEAASIKNGGQTGNPLSSVTRVLIESTANRTDGTQALASKIHHEVNELEKTRKELETFRSLASTDHVTQLLNRRSFDEHLQKIYEGPDARTAGVMLLDIDHFKIFNDTHGHPLGDVILKRVADTIKASIRPDIVAARVGGEEFALITKNLEVGVVELVAEKIRIAVENLTNIDRKTGKDFGQVTISIGICMADKADNAQTLYRYTDEMLYRSKAKGRNCTTTYPGSLPQTEAETLDYNGRYFRLQ
jgi:diguanylate cyclase